jgi:non-specific serine/threonine protein kinase
VADLLRSAPGLQVLATSREPLRVEGEVAWRVPSLSAPDLESMSSLEELAAYEAVELFLERARAARPSLELRPGDASALARIVARLDGIPLALELAAARMGVLSLEQIAERLTNRFSLLASTGRGAPSRHQTLRAAIDWSYELLAPAECELLTRLSVFPASFELEAAEAVGTKEGDEPGTVLDLLDSLVAKSLVVMDPGPTGTRYRLLETIRHYAAEKLAGTPAEAEARTRHRDFYLGLAQVAEPEAFGSDAPTVLDRLEADHDNFRAVLELATVDPGSRLAGLRLAHALYPLWEVRDHRQEGRTWMEALVAAPGPADDALASAVARRAGNLARTALDLDGAAHLWGQALALAERSGDPRHRGRALLSMGRLHHSRGTLASARTMMEDSLALARQVGDEFFVAESLVWLGWLAHEEGRYQEARARVGHGEAAAGDNWLHIGRLLNLLGCVERDQGDYPTASACFERCREVGASVDDRYAQAEALDGLGSVALAEDRLGDARAAFEEAVVIMRRAPAIATSGPLGGLAELAALQGEHGAAAGLLGEELEYARRMVDPYWVACTLVRLGRAEQARNDLEGAAHAFCEALAITSDAGMPLPLAGALEGLVAVRAAQGAAQEGALLMARAQALRRAIDAPLAPSACPGWEQTVGAIRNALGEARFAADWAAGEAMALEEAVALALGEDWTEATPSV